MFNFLLSFLGGQPLTPVHIEETQSTTTTPSLRSASSDSTIGTFVTAHTSIPIIRVYSSVDSLPSLVSVSTTASATSSLDSSLHEWKQTYVPSFRPSPRKASSQIFLKLSPERKAQFEQWKRELDAEARQVRLKKREELLVARGYDLTKRSKRKGFQPTKATLASAVVDCTQATSRERFRW